MHHIALATKNITATTTAWSNAGATLLPMPENYYDDLAARLALDDETLTNLQTQGLLYDKDEQGDFKHLYTEAFQDRFFFEAVQRNNYNGFGAPNAPIRSAAQARSKQALGSAQAR